MSPVDLGIPGKFAVTIDDVFTAEECKQLVDLAESNRFHPAALGANQRVIKEVRNSDRWMTDDPKMAADIFQRIRLFIPETWEGLSIVGLNERLRFLKYAPGGYFKAHYDGVYERPDGSEQSFITLQIYLNGGTNHDSKLIGGETTFFKERALGKEKITAVEPKAGKVLLFEHDILHEGSRVIEGVKYVIRTDVMYAT